MVDKTVADGVKETLVALGVNLEDENFKDTPKRVAKALAEILRFEDENDRKSHLGAIFSKSFPTKYHGIVGQKNIKAVSMCPHHMQPIQYSIDVGYVAKDKALGLSKIVRVVDCLAARMVLQETLTQDIADTFSQGLQTEGVMVVVRGKHGCMTNRGVKQEVVTMTSSIAGIFENDIPLRQEFLSLNS